MRLLKVAVRATMMVRHLQFSLDLTQFSASKNLDVGADLFPRPRLSSTKFNVPENKNVLKSYT